MMGTETGGGTAAPPQPPKVHSDHQAAHDGIEALRTVAATLRDIGNELVEERRGHHITRDELNRVTEQLVEAEYVCQAGAEALAAVDDFRLGLCDRDELLRRVCGRS